MSRPKSQKKYQAILIAASALFLKYGFTAVSMEMIRDEACVSKNTLYNHFENKKALFEAVILDYWRNESTPRVFIEEGEPMHSTLTRFAKSLIKHLYDKKTQSFFRILVAEAERFPGLAKSIILNNQPPILLSFTQYLKNEIKFNQAKAESSAIYFFGLLKEDAFWHVLAGFRKPYTKSEIDAHVANVVPIFINLIRW